MPNSLTRIGDCAFYECNDLKSLEIPDSVTYIGEYAFYGCYHLKSIALSNGVTYIGRQAFYGCLDLNSIEFPDSVTHIGDWAFDGCKKLRYVTFMSSNVFKIKIGEDIFHKATPRCLFVTKNACYICSKNCKAYAECKNKISKAIVTAAKLYPNYKYSELVPVFPTLYSPWACNLFSHIFIGNAENMYDDYDDYMIDSQFAMGEDPYDGLDFLGPDD